MSFIYSKYLTDAQGNVLSGATVTVRRETDGGLASIYSDRSGTVKVNPFTTGSDGLAEFYAVSGEYRVQATKGSTSLDSRYSLISSINVVNTTLTSALTLSHLSPSNYFKVDSTIGAFTLTLPAASLMAGREYTFTKTNSTANNVTIDAAGSETIDGFPSLILYSARDTLTIWCDGTEWRVKDYSARGTFLPTMLGVTNPGTNTYSLQLGKFTRIGHQVFINIILQLATKDVAMAGNIRLGNLPFNIPSGNENILSAAVSLVSNIDLTAGYTQFGVNGAANSNQLNLLQAGDNIGGLNLTAAAISATSRIDISCSYSLL